MRKTIIDMGEISDSKEVYGRRPNPVIAVFIYGIVALLVTAIVYCCIGKMEIVVRTNGVVRPNDDVSTLSSLISGRITSVLFADGQIVKEGDVLITLDTSDLQLSLDSMQSIMADYEWQVEMIEKFIAGIKNEENPFCDDVNNAEYTYYIQYQDYILGLKNSKKSFDYDTATANANINAADVKIGELQKRIDGLTAYKESVQQGINLAAAYPEYEKMYQLYEASLNALDADYISQKEKVELDNAESTNRYYIDYYQRQLAEYDHLIQAIETGNPFSIYDDSDACKLLYENYCNAMEEYERNYLNARETYYYYLEGGDINNNAAELLAYDKSMLEGYKCYMESVINDTDMFFDSADSAYYRSLYIKYKDNCERLLEEMDLASTAYFELISNIDATEEEIATALKIKEDAEIAYAEYKPNTLLDINNTILQIEASIAQKEISIGLGSETHDYNVTTSKTKMDSAQAEIEAYKAQILAEYHKTRSSIADKIDELLLSAESIQDKETVLFNLEQNHLSAKEQYYYQTITQIDSSLQSARAELSSVKANRKLYQIAGEMYTKSTDENGKPLSIALATMEQASALLSEQDTLERQIDDLKVKMLQTEMQISQGNIIAERDGIINTITTLVRGDALTSGVVIATIIPFNESEYTVQLHVSNSDIAHIKVGDPIKYNLAALPSNQYGLVDGYVTGISSDALMMDGQYSGYFLVEGSIDNAELTDRDGNVGSIAIGMQTEAKIVTQEKAIIRYLLEKINLF